MNTTEFLRKRMQKTVLREKRAARSRKVIAIFFIIFIVVSFIFATKTFFLSQIQPEFSQAHNIETEQIAINETQPEKTGDENDICEAISENETQTERQSEEVYTVLEPEPSQEEPSIENTANESAASESSASDTINDSAICRLIIPSVGVDADVYYDESFDAPNHYDLSMDKFAGTIGSQDRMIILGHNTGTLSVLHKCNIGDLIYIKTKERTLTYKIELSQVGVIPESGLNVVDINTGEKLMKYAPTPTKYLNLYTCYRYPDVPYYTGTTNYRYVVRAVLQ